MNAVEFFIPFGRVQRQPQAWWSPEVEEAVSEKRKAFAAATKNTFCINEHLTKDRSRSTN